MVDLEGMHTWPSLRLGYGAGDERGGEAPTYFEPTVEGLATRAAEAAASWSGGEAQKIARPGLTSQELYKAPEAHPLALMLVVVDRYGPELFDWDPEVLRATMMRDAYQVSGANWAKIMAMRTYLMSPSPWRQWEVFHWCARALSGMPPNFTYMEEPVLGHLAHAADVMKVVDPARETMVEVDKFVAAVLRNDGHVYAPPPLSFAQRALEEPRLHCNQCGAEFPDDNDIKCIPCGSSDLARIPYPWQVLRDQVKEQFQARIGRDVVRAVEGLGDDAAGNLTYDLLTQWQHPLAQRQQLVEQLRLLAK